MTSQETERTFPLTSLFLVYQANYCDGTKSQLTISANELISHQLDALDRHAVSSFLEDQASHQGCYLIVRKGAEDTKLLDIPPAAPSTVVAPEVSEETSNSNDEGGSNA